VKSQVDLGDQWGMRLKTRHSKDFSLCGGTGPLDHSRSPYALTFSADVYVDKCRVLSDYIDTDQFLWCIADSRDFPEYECQKPMEWIIKVNNNRIVGCVNESRWSRFLSGKEDLQVGCFASKFPRSWSGDPSSYLVAYPLQSAEIVEWRLYGDNNRIIKKGTLKDRLVLDG